MKRLYTSLFSTLLLLFGYFLPSICFGQTLTQSGFTGVIVPQYMGSGTSTRLPVMFRATVSGLTASTVYRYYIQGATNSTTGGGTVDFGFTNSGAGNPLLVNTAGTTFISPSSPSLATPGTSCETFTTDATGNYTGWFGFVNTGNPRFTAGNSIFPTITLNGGGTGTTVASRRALDLGISVLGYSTTSGANNGSFMNSSASSATAKNVLAVYDNIAGTGRPLSISLIENIGLTNTTTGLTAYLTTAGSWNTVIPNVNANGVRRIEQRSITTANIVGCATDADGIWTTGTKNTVNPVNGTTAVSISNIDAPLNTCDAGIPMVSLSISSNSSSETNPTAITVTATASSAVSGNQTVDLGVSGTGITAGDYTLSNSTITILSGQTMGSVTFTVVDDAIYEGTETATLTISSPSSGITFGTPVSQNITITDNDPQNTAPTIVKSNTTTAYLDVPTNSPAFVSGVISDPTDPASNLGIDFTINDAETAANALTVTVSSSNTSVVPLANLTLSGTNALRSLKIIPLGVGYSTINVTVSDGSLTSSYTISYAASGASSTPANSRYHTGKSDASTAIVIDADYMLVGDDEDQKLRLYNRNNSGLPVNSFDFTTSLNLTDISGGIPREVDIEASMKVGNSIYWMGSESNAAGGNARPNRNRIFKTDIAGTGANTTLSYVSRYDFMKQDILAWDANNVHGKGANYYGLTASATTGVIPESTNLNGFNIEGLETAPDNTTAYIAFRAPQTIPDNRTKALIIPVTNFSTILSNTGGTIGSAVFGTPIELNLDGRGIREIRKNTNNEYLIITGASTDGIAIKDFRLYSWTGNPDDAPIRLSTDLTGINAEGSYESLLEVPAGLTTGSNVQLLLDSGGNNWYADGTASKDLAQINFQKFRSETVTLGAASLITGTISNSSICESSTFNVPFTINESYASGNIFTAQLSDNTGNFNSPTTIGTLTGTSSGNISVTIPIAQTVGTAYQIRVISSSPSVIGIKNGVDLTVNPKVTPTFTAVAPICAGTTLSALPTTSNNSITGTWSPALDNTTTTVYTFTPDAGQCANSATLTITVNPKPANPTNVTVNTTICSGNGVILSATCSDGSLVKWYENDEITPLPTTNIPDLPASKTFKVRCETANCESAFANVTITVNSPTIPTIPQDTVTIAVGTSVTLQANGCSGTIKWFNNSGLLVNMPVSPKCSESFFAQCETTIGGTACTSPSSRKVYLKITHPFEVTSMIAGGNWEDSTTWSGGRIPQNGDLVIISQNHTVFVISGTAKAQCLEMRNNANLQYSNTSSKLSLGF